MDSFLSFVDGYTLENCYDRGATAHNFEAPVAELQSRQQYSTALVEKCEALESKLWRTEQMLANFKKSSVSRWIFLKLGGCFKLEWIVVMKLFYIIIDYMVTTQSKCTLFIHLFQVSNCIYCMFIVLDMAAKHNFLS